MHTVSATYEWAYRIGTCGCVLLLIFALLSF